MVERRALLKVTVSLHRYSPSDISPLVLVSEFIFDSGQILSRSAAFNESISAHKHICFCKVNVGGKTNVLCSGVYKIVVSRADD